jgi:hypothetical protein
MMGGYEQLTVVLCLTFLAVIAINALILAMFRRNRPFGELEALRKLAQSARNPTAKDAAQLEELSRLVAKFKTTPHEVEDEEGEPHG